MEKYLELLYNRLEDANKKKMLLYVMNNAINELYNNKMFEKMNAEDYLMTRDADDEIRVMVKSNFAKQYGKKCFISSELRVLNKSEVIIASKIAYDPNWKYSIGLYLQTGMEGLCRNGIFERTPGHVAQYHIYICDEALKDKDFVYVLNVISYCYLDEVQLCVHTLNETE